MKNTETATPPEYPFAYDSPIKVPPEIRNHNGQAAFRVTLPSGDTAWLLTRYQDIRELLSDDRLSRNLTRPGTARMTKDNQMFQDPNVDPDPPEHTRMRRLISRAFSAARVERLRPRIEEIARDLVRTMTAGSQPACIKEELGYALTVKSVSELLGVPEKDHPKFRSWVDAFLSVSKYSGEEIMQARMGLWSYIEELIASRRENPQDDLVSALIEARDDESGRLSEYELTYWCMSLLVAGYETTVNALAGTVVMLLAHPEEYDNLKRDPDLLESAVEELLRRQTVGQSLPMMRYVVSDVEISDGTVIKAGECLIPALEFANHDPEVYDDPHKLDFTRTPNRQMTFSHGTHFCAGAALARVQLQSAFRVLLEEVPTLRLAAPPEELERDEGALMQGFRKVQVAW